MSATVAPAPAAPRAVPPREAPDAARAPGAARGRAPLVLWVVLTAVYAVAGHRLVVGLHVADAGAVARLARAAAFWHHGGRLATLGVRRPPAPGLVLLPAAAIRPLVRSLAALPLTAAPLGALAVAVTDRTLARGGMRVRLRAPLLLALGLNPLVAFAATAHPGLALELALVAVAAHGLLGWRASGGPRHLLTAGVALGLLVLARPGYALVAAGVAVAQANGLARRDSPAAQLEGTALALLAPAAYTAAAWTLVCAVAGGRPAAWIGPLHAVPGLRDAVPLLAAALALAALLHRGRGSARPVVWAATLALAVAAGPAAWLGMRHARAGGAERAWTQAVRTGAAAGPAPSSPAP